MSIAYSLGQTRQILELAHKRKNGDLEQMVPEVIERLKADEERVKGLEQVACISQCDYSSQYDSVGGTHVTTGD